MGFKQQLIQQQAFDLNKRSIICLIVLIAAGFVGNYLRWSFFFNIDFLFGTIPVWIVMAVYGKIWGILAGILSGTCTYFLWLHPYAIIIFTCEAIFVSVFFHRKTQNIVLLDAIYWLLIGMPLVWLFYANILGVESVQARIILLKQPVNGIFNALISSLMLTYLPIDKWVAYRPFAKTLGLRQTLFNWLVAFVFFPTLMLMVIDSYRVVDNIKSYAETELKISSNHFVSDISFWHQEHIRALENLQEIASRVELTKTQELQSSLAATKALFPDFKNFYLVDEAEKVISVLSDLENSQGVINNLLKLNPSFFKVLYGDNPTNPSSIFVTLNDKGLPQIFLAVSTPKKERDRITILAELDTAGLNQILNLNFQGRGLQLTLLDSTNSVISSTQPQLIGQKNFNRRANGDISLLNSGAYQWLPTQGSPLLMVRWTNSFFIQETRISPQLPWIAILELPAAEQVRGIQQIHTKNLTILLMISSIALVLAETVSRQLIKPLSQLAKVTTNLPDKLLDKTPIQWPKSSISELASLVHNFRLMSSSLTQKFLEIQRAKETLEERVKERTQALVDINQTLAAEITERQQVENALRESEERFRQMAENIHEVFWMVSVGRHQVLYVSPAYEEIWGLTCQSLYEKPQSFLDAVHPEDRDRVAKLIVKKIQGKYDLEYRIIQPNREIRWIRDRAFPVLDETGEIYRIVGVAQDVTASKQAQEKLLYNAFYDPLTGLPNRSLFMDRLKQNIARTQRNPELRFGVLFLDLNRFKVVNDSLGHLVGDQLLIGTAKRLESCLRPGDTVARLGGDEFTILLENIQDISEATAVAQRIHEVLEAPFYLEGAEVFASASIGITLNTNSHQQPEELLRDADSAMYRAKKQRHSNYAIFDTAMYEHAVQLLRLETDLRRAIERQELRVYYQPIISLSTGKIIGFEALVRWQHSTQGLIPPGQFISVAEETGLIIPIDGWVLRESCFQLKKWQERFGKKTDLKISVNLSVKQLSQPNLVEKIDATIRDTQINPANLKLEMTESGIMENARFAATLLAQLKALGVQLSIDDFGTGYSSLSRLHEFPIDTLKVDRLFVDRMGNDAEGIKMVQTIVILAHNLGMDLIAEGVETAQQLALLRTLECEAAQGYFFAPALSQEAAEELLARSPQW